MRDTRTTAEMDLARLRADAPSDTRGVDGEQARRCFAAPGGKQALRHQDRLNRTRRHREPGRRAGGGPDGTRSPGDTATASSIEESGPALRRVPGPSAKRQSSEMGVTP